MEAGAASTIPFASEAAMRRITSSRTCPPTRFHLPTALLATFLFLVAVPRPAFAQAGKWTPPDSTIGGTAVHVALIPGDGQPFHSRILWWQEEGSTSFVGGQWGWRDSSAIDCQSYPRSVFTPLGLPDPGANMDRALKGRAVLTYLTRFDERHHAEVAG